MLRGLPSPAVTPLPQGVFPSVSANTSFSRPEPLNRFALLLWSREDLETLPMFERNELRRGVCGDRQRGERVQRWCSVRACLCRRGRHKEQMEGLFERGEGLMLRKPLGGGDSKLLMLRLKTKSPRSSSGDPAKEPKNRVASRRGGSPLGSPFRLWAAGDDVSQEAPLGAPPLPLPCSAQRAGQRTVFPWTLWQGLGCSLGCTWGPAGHLAWVAESGAFVRAGARTGRKPADPPHPQQGSSSDLHFPCAQCGFPPPPPA